MTAKPHTIIKCDDKKDLINQLMDPMDTLESNNAIVLIYDNTPENMEHCKKQYFGSKIEKMWDIFAEISIALLIWLTIMGLIIAITSLVSRHILCKASEDGYFICVIG